MSESLNRQSGNKPKVGFTASAFDLLHAGHVLMLEEAKTQCDYLVVALQSDPSLDRPTKNKPIESLIERQIKLSAVKYIDKVIVYDTESDLLELLKALHPDVRILGTDHKNDDFTGKDWCIDNNVEIYYNSRNHDYSSSSLRERIEQRGKNVSK